MWILPVCRYLQKLEFLLPSLPENFFDGSGAALEETGVTISNLRCDGYNAPADAYPVFVSVSQRVRTLPRLPPRIERDLWALFLACPQWPC